MLKEKKDPKKYYVVTAGAALGIHHITYDEFRKLPGKKNVKRQIHVLKQRRF